MFSCPPSTSFFKSVDWPISYLHAYESTQNDETVLIKAL